MSSEPSRLESSFQRSSIQQSFCEPRVSLIVSKASGDRRNPGSVLFYNTPSRMLAGGTNHIVTVGSLPDMLTFTADGKRLLVANEATP